MNLANRISVVRIVLVPFFVAAVLYFRFTAALAIFIICIISDALDGYFARVKGERTKLGALLDPIADKLLLVSAFIALSATKGLPQYLRFPLYVPIIVVSRDLLIILGCIVIYLLKGKIDIRPSYLGKATTFFQMISVVGVLAQFSHSAILWNIAVGLTVLSGLDYLRIAGRILNDHS